MGKHHKLGPYILLAFLVIILVIIYQKFLLKGVTPSIVKEYILSLGGFAPIVLIAVLIALGIASIIPNTPFIIAAGYVFGTWLGALYGFIGIMLGSSIVFALSKTLGKPFVGKLIDKEELKHFDTFFEKKGIYSLFIARLIPMFPADVTSFAAGLTEIRYRTYALITAATIIPPLILQNFFGSILTEVKEMNVLLMVLAVILAVLLIVSYVFRHKLKQIFIKELRIVEEDIKRAEKRAAGDIRFIEKEVSLNRGVKSRRGVKKVRR